jgi:NAD(P)-dependent dehydrogenase (short-subunit alcohol dehydrogenase family)
MTNQVVLITGALSGIGRATAVAFAKEGASVVVSGRKDEAGNALVTELRGLGAEAEFIRADVRRDGEFAISSTRRSPSTADSMSPSTTPALRGSQAS